MLPVYFFDNMHIKHRVDAQEQHICSTSLLIESVNSPPVGPPVISLISPITAWAGQCGNICLLESIYARKLPLWTTTHLIMNDTMHQWNRNEWSRMGRIMEKCTRLQSKAGIGKDSHFSRSWMLSLGELNFESRVAWAKHNLDVLVSDAWPKREKIIF